MKFQILVLDKIWVLESAIYEIWMHSLGDFNAVSDVLVSLITVRFVSSLK